jgi:hypothetical protein
MNEKGMAIAESFLALILVVIVVLAIISYGPKLWDLILISIGLGKLETNNINNEKIATIQAKSEIKGEVGPVFLIKMEDSLATQKPTSPDHCLVGTFVKNNGRTTWTETDKVRATLFCKHIKNQVKDIFVQNYPALQDYIIDLKPGEQKEVLFASRFPNNCVESFEKYQIILYSNCEGKGTQYQPCDNFGADPTKHPKILNMVEFNCKIS